VLRPSCLANVFMLIIFKSRPPLHIQAACRLRDLDSGVGGMKPLQGLSQKELICSGDEAAKRLRQKGMKLDRGLGVGKGRRGKIRGVIKHRGLGRSKRT
jgi:hypothetical protein